MAVDRDAPNPIEQVARLYEQTESEAAKATERLVGSGGFSSLLGQLAENGAALTKLSGDAFDLVVRNGVVVDGTGEPARRADIGISDGRIVESGTIAAGSGQREIDAEGLVVSPGFIDGSLQNGVGTTLGWQRDDTTITPVLFTQDASQL